ncbi:phosphorylase family protein [Streptomyces sp. SAS_270]|uniref:phosphorylase family protein n=1 Tax=Streptomyces sp. SAS_270 TaxID=3412748 RepID=UPI00403C01F2
MGSVSWQARIHCGRNTGAGILVSERLVLTCAHVVAGSPTEPLSVSFPFGGSLGKGGLRESGGLGAPNASIPARVIAHGGWAGGNTDPGDLAILELDYAVAIEPAQFAEPSEAYGDPSPRLLAYGYPRSYDEGTLVELRVTAAVLIASEWMQLEPWNTYGQPFGPGFSGAAVTLAKTGRVVGMVSMAGARSGRMMPVQVLARYWPPFGDLIPTVTWDRQQKKSLRQLIEALTRHDNGREYDPHWLYHDAVGPLGPPPPHRLSSLWEVAWYLLFEVPDETAVDRFTARLAEITKDTPVRAALQSWTQNRPNPAHLHGEGADPAFKSPDTRHAPTVVVLTALPVEYNAVQRHLASIEKISHPSGTRFERGVLPGTPWHVILTQSGVGNGAAAVITERAYAWFQPDALLFVGVAGGLKDDIALGDVVVATKVYGYHGGKQTPDGFHSSPTAWEAPHRLQQAALAALRTNAGVHFKPIAAGEVVLNSLNSALTAQLKHHYTDAVAIEMESAGVAQAAHLTGELQALTIRGISDKADGLKHVADAHNWQFRAAEAAAQAAVAVLAELDPPRGRTQQWPP